jgi:hypothetical protein
MAEKDLISGFHRIQGKIINFLLIPRVNYNTFIKEFVKAVQSLTVNRASSKAAQL